MRVTWAKVLAEDVETRPQAQETVTGEKATLWVRGWTLSNMGKNSEAE